MKGVIELKKLMGLKIRFLYNIEYIQNVSESFKKIAKNAGLYDHVFWIVGNVCTCVLSP